MSIYNKIFRNIYPNGWKSSPDKSTPINAEALQQYTDFMLGVEDYLVQNPIEKYYELAQMPDTEISDKQIGDYLTYENGKWINKSRKTDTLIPEKLQSEFPAATAEFPAAVYTFQSSGYFKIIDKYCFLTLRIKIISFSTSVLSEWQTMIDYQFPKPREGVNINGIATYYDETSGFSLIKGKEHMPCRITPDGYLQIFGAKKDKMYSIYMVYLCE